MANSSVTKVIRPGAPGGMWGPDEPGRIVGRLAEEFAAPIGLLDPIGPTWRAHRGAPEAAFPEAGACLAASQAAGLLGPGRVMLWRPEAHAGPVWLGLPVPRPRAGAALALVGFAAGTSAEPPWGPPCPARALRAWGRAVADRLRAEVADPSPERSRELPLFDRLVRRLRVSDPPERFQHLVAAALRDALEVAAVAWVPGHRREPIVVAGAAPGRDGEALRALVPESPRETVRVVNHPTGPREAAFRRILVVAAAAEAATGWLVAVDPADGRPFARPEIELMQPVASLIGTQRANARLYDDLKDLLFGVIRALTSAIDAKDPYTCGHSERVARIAVRLGEAMGLSATRRGDLYLMGLLHDVGKIGVDDAVLKKPGKLTEDEYRQIQAHVRIGVHILSDLKKLQHLLPGVAHHHENMDGTGYPAGLSGDAIPMEARILAVADAFDAMSSDRPYRRRLGPPQIDAIFRAGAGRQWDPGVIDALFTCRADVDHIRQKGLGESLQRVVDDTLGRA